MIKKGIQAVAVSDEILSNIYSTPWVKPEGFDIDPNTYLICLRGPAESQEEVGPFLWTGSRFEEIAYPVFNSDQFGEIKPKDKYQVAYMNSLIRNQLTFATGPAGSGKTQIALAYYFQEKEKGKFDRIVIFVNTLVAQGAAKLGYYPGEKVDKLLETSIGSILISKLGRVQVEEMIEREEIILIPMGDARGYETPPDSFVYFTEAQNTDRYLMKLFLQRINDDVKVCVEGDIRQVDSHLFESVNNGLSRAIDVFVGEDYAGHINLKNIYRGRIARKAEEICEIDIA